MVTNKRNRRDARSDRDHVVVPVRDSTNVNSGSREVKEREKGAHVLVNLVVPWLKQLQRMFVTSRTTSERV